MFDIPKGFFETIFALAIIGAVLGVYEIGKFVLWLAHHVSIN